MPDVDAGYRGAYQDWGRAWWRPGIVTVRGLGGREGPVKMLGKLHDLLSVGFRLAGVGIGSGNIDIMLE